MINRLDEEHLCLCPPMKLLTNNLLNFSKKLTVFGGILLNRTCIGPLRVVRKALHNLVWNPLKVHCSPESNNMIERVTRSVIRIQGRHLELQRQGVTIDGSREKGV